MNLKDLCFLLLVLTGLGTAIFAADAIAEGMKGSEKQQEKVFIQMLRDKAEFNKTKPNYYSP